MSGVRPTAAASAAKPSQPFPVTPHGSHSSLLSAMCPSASTNEWVFPAPRHIPPSHPSLDHHHHHQLQAPSLSLQCPAAIPPDTLIIENCFLNNIYSTLSLSQPHVMPPSSLGPASHPPSPPSTCLMSFPPPTHPCPFPFYLTLPPVPFLFPSAADH